MKTARLLLPILLILAACAPAALGDPYLLRQAADAAIQSTEQAYRDAAAQLALKQTEQAVQNAQEQYHLEQQRQQLALQQTAVAIENQAAEMASARAATQSAQQTQTAQNATQQARRQQIQAFTDWAWAALQIFLMLLAAITLTAATLGLRRYLHARTQAARLQNDNQGRWVYLNENEKLTFVDTHRSVAPVIEISPSSSAQTAFAPADVSPAQERATAREQAARLAAKMPANPSQTPLGGAPLNGFGNPQQPPIISLAPGNPLVAEILADVRQQLENAPYENH